MKAEQYDEGQLAADAIAGWKHDPEVQSEFIDVNQYHAYLKAKLEGRVKIIEEQQNVQH